MDQKILELIDRQEILAIMHRYARGIDRWDADLVRSCYFEDAIDDHGGYVGGVEGLIEYAQETSRGFLSTQHMICNHNCELDGDEAHAETYFMCFCSFPGENNLISVGRYIDHLQKRNGEWRLAARVVLIDKNYDAPTFNFSASSDEGSTVSAKYLTSRDKDDVSYVRPVEPVL